MIGFPDWYKDMQKNRQMFAGKSWNPSLAVKPSLKNIPGNAYFFASISELIKREVTRIVKDKDMEHELELSYPILAHCIHDMAGKYSHRFIKY